ncbi:ABC transporter substrate-binding protein [Corallococcus interemptor]|uniref:ABC transporter substrate-binding protein n=1 Tax=Corallococcus interemptor TaxID=2316720 RepID=UPI0035D3F52E
MRTTLRRLALLTLLLPVVALAQAPSRGPTRPRVVAVKSSSLAPYASFLAGFTSEARADVTELTLEESPTEAARVFKSLAAQKPALVLALGPLAANAARRSLGEDVPVLFAMVPYHEKYGLEAPHVTGIALTSDFGPELAALKAVAPGAKRVGILHDPRSSAGAVAQARSAGAGLGLTIIPLAVEAQERVGEVLEGAAGKVDGLLMVADKTVGNASVVQALIAFSASRKVPLVALTASQVKEGATLALAPAPLALGQQAGRLANRIIHEKVAPGALAVARPEGLDLSFNLTAAKKSGPSCDVALEVLRFAARRDFAVKVYE